MAASKNLTAEQRSIRARIAANRRWSQEDPRPTAERAQAGLLDRFRREIVAEQGDIAEPELTRRAKARRREHMQRLSFQASKSPEGGVVSPPEKGGGGPRQTPNTTPHQGDRHRKDQVSGDGNPVTELLDSFIGLEVDGGCDDCNAYQTIERLSVGVYVNHIHHDDTCPWWIRYQAATR